MSSKSGWHVALLALWLGTLRSGEALALTRDVFDVAGAGALCPVNSWILIPVDLEPTVDGPSGSPETGVYVENTRGRITFDGTALNSSYVSGNGCAGSDQARATIRFVNMNAAGFDAGDPASWQYKDIRWITVTLSGGGAQSGTTPPILQLDAYREINGGSFGNDSIGTCLGGACEFVDPTGAPGQGVGIEELRYISSWSDSTGLANLILRTFYQDVPTGSNVLVPFLDVSVNFPTISTAGRGTVFHWPGNPISAALPAGLFNCDPVRFYTLETSAFGSGAITVCITYPETCNENGIALYHYHQTSINQPLFGWENVTSSVSTAGNVICGGPTPPSLFSLRLDAVNWPYAVLSTGPPCTAEVCDGVDNDCDAAIDEGFGVGQTCTAGIGACQRTGTNSCNASGGVICSATPGSPTPETCNNVDDDCNGTIDNGFSVGVACAAGVGECARNGIRVCNGAGTGTVCNAVPGSPTAEICDGRDNDCDGTADEGNPGGGGVCATGLPGPCGTGALVCSASSLQCAQTVFATPETCNAVDDDCDGSADEGASDAPTWYADADADTYGNPSISQAQCVQPGGYVANSQDCDDANPALGICNTPAGPDPVTFDDPAGVASVTFPGGSVITPGDTTITSAPCAGPPVGIFVVPNPICVDIDTTATFSGVVEVCFHYDATGLSLAQEQALRMVRYPDAAGCAAEDPPLPFPCPEGLPTSGPNPGPAPDTDNDIICATTDGFSQFAVGMLTDVDNDFVQDVFDNCPLVQNFFQQDGDGDAAGDVCDNCRVFPNSTQADVNGNGIGNLCECGDQSGDGRVDVRDLVAISNAIFNPAQATPLCDANNDSQCNVSDIVSANLKTFGSPAYCSRFPPP